MKKAKSTLIIACLALAFLMTVGTTAAQAQSDSCCACYVNWIVGAPFYLAAGALIVGSAIVTAPFSYCGCSSGNCGFALLCNPGFSQLFPKCNTF
jgi:hypothetical protein